MSDLNILIPHVWSRIILLFVYIYGTILVLKSPTEDIYALRKKITLLFVFSVITSLEILYHSFLNFRAVATSLDFVFQSFKQIPFLFLLEITNIGFFGEPNSEHNGLKQITNEDISQTNINQMTHKNIDLVNNTRLEVESERTINNAIDNKRIEFLSPKRTISLGWKIIYTIILWVFWALFASAIFGDGPFGTIIQGIVQIGGTIFVWKQPSK